MIDLHTHSAESDGILRPSELVRRAAEAGLTALALTDHDTTAGLAEAAAAGREHGIEVVPGVEISIEHSPGTFHLIGLFIDPEDEALADALVRVREGRAERNERMAELLTSLNFEITVADAEKHAGGDLVARPHFAREMVRLGYVRTLKEAFDFWLGKGCKAYVERLLLGAEEAIGLIHGAGGVAVLCHPHTLGGEEELEPFVADLAAMGLDAMEVRYKETESARERRYARIAKRQGLLESGGSDYHGHTKSDHRLGLGSMPLEPDLLEAIRERAR
ncbi:MAG: PHP domain-containing protein [Planctomycetota bacterium]